MKLLRNLLTLAVVLAAIAVGLAFAAQNTALVPLDLLVYTFEPVPFSWLMLGAFALGSLLGILAGSLINLRLRNALRLANRKLSKTGAELEKLRGAALPEGD